MLIQKDLCLQKYVLENLITWNNNLKTFSGAGGENGVPPCWKYEVKACWFLSSEQIYFVMK